MAYPLRRAARRAKRTFVSKSLRRRRLGSEWLERREMMDGSSGEPFPPNADIHAHLSIFLNGQTMTLPTNIGADANGVAFDNPHTEGAVSGNKLHMHAIDGVDPQNLFTIGDFFEVWRTNA